MGGGGKECDFLRRNVGRIVVRNHEWFRDALLVTVEMFWSMVLEMNLENSETMVCPPGFIWGKWGENVYKRHETGEGATYQ